LAPEQLPHSPSKFCVHLKCRQLASLDQDDYNAFSHKFMTRARKLGWLPPRAGAVNDPHRVQYNPDLDQAGRMAFLSAVYPAIRGVLSAITIAELEGQEKLNHMLYFLHSKCQINIEPKP
jgi:hypothetical protein